MESYHVDKETSVPITCLFVPSDIYILYHLAVFLSPIIKRMFRVLFFLLLATDTCLCQKPGSLCVTGSWQQAGVTGTGSQGFFRRFHTTNEGDD